MKFNTLVAPKLTGRYDHPAAVGGSRTGGITLALTGMMWDLVGAVPEWHSGESSILGTLRKSLIAG